MVCVSERGEGGEELAQQEDSAWADMLEGSDYPELFSPGGCIKKDCSALSPRISHQVSKGMDIFEILGVSCYVFTYTIFCGFSSNHQYGKTITMIIDQGPAMSPRGPASVHQEIFCRAKFIRRQGVK